MWGAISLFRRKLESDNQLLGARDRADDQTLRFDAALNNMSQGLGMSTGTTGSPWPTGITWDVPALRRPRPTWLQPAPTFGSAPSLGTFGRISKAIWRGTPRGHYRAQDAELPTGAS